MLALKVQLLGEFRVWWVTPMREELIAPHEWPTRQTKSLFKILALNPGRILLKDQLIDFLWPDAELDQALNRLWVTVSMLRRLLEPSLPQASGSHFIRTQGEGYMLDATRIWFDTSEFLGKIRQGDKYKNQKKLSQAIAAYRAAEELYQGDLLEEDRYEEWALIPREQFQEAYYRLLQGLGDCYAAQRRFSEALKAYQRALTRNVCRENIWQRLMLCHYQLGERDRVLQAFEQCRQALRTHLGLQPSTATMELCQQLVKEAGVLTLPPPRNTYSVSAGLERSLVHSDPSVSPLASGSALHLLRKFTGYSSCPHKADNIEQSLRCSSLSVSVFPVLQHLQRPERHDLCSQ